VWFTLYLTKKAAEEATAISHVSTETFRVSDGKIYNIAGQRVDEDYKGIVIMNGKKYIRK